MKIDLVLTKISTDDVWGISVHTTHHYPLRNHHLGLFVNTFSTCGITLSHGKKVNLQLVNQMAALAQKSPSRVHFHTGSLAMPVWNKKAKKYFQIKNTFRSPHIILNKVSTVYVS